jgi:hypothetical protein
MAKSPQVPSRLARTILGTLNRVLRPDPLKRLEIPL